MLSGWRLGARTVDTSVQRLVCHPDYCCTELPNACNDEWDLVSTLSSGSSGPTPPGVILLPIALLQNSLHIAMDARGPAIDVSNSGGGRYRACRQHSPGGPPSTSPTPVVAAARPAASTPPGGPSSTSPTPVVAAVGPAASTHQGACYRCFTKLGTCRQNFSSDTYQGGHRGKQYHYKQATWRKNGGKSFSKKNQIIVVQEPESHNTITKVQINRQCDDIINYWNNRKRRKSYSRAEALCVLRLTLEPLCYRAGSILNVIPGSLRRPFDGPSHRRLQGDTGVTTPEAH
jgi:hypothetical protein